MQVAPRADRVRARLEPDGADALLVTKPANVRWLTGFTGSNGTVLVTENGLVLFTDGRYRMQADSEIDASGVDVDVVITRRTFDEVATVAAARRIGTLAVEAEHISWARQQHLVASMAGGDSTPSTVVVASNATLDELRGPKDRGERSRLIRAAAIADGAFEACIPRLLEGDSLTEQDVARLLEDAMYAGGADGLSFDTIVASGPNSARPHARPSDRIIEAGDLVVLDFGASVEGYGSDMTRTVVAGGAPTPEQQDWYDVVAASQQAGVDTVAAGVEAFDVDRRCRDVLAEHGMEEYLDHGTGHGIGLEIHEPPILSATAVGILRADLVVTVEPGAYREGFGGVRVEDSVVVTSNGCEPITHSRKGLVPF